MVRDPATGRYRRTRLFVMTLGHSRKSVRLLVFGSSTQTWAELHEGVRVPRHPPVREIDIPIEHQVRSYPGAS